jgi:hypothetical protein
MVNVPNFIAKVAYTLRQIAVEEIAAHPEGYPTVDFTHATRVADEDKQTALEAMSLPTTWIDETAIAAIANALEVPVTVRVTEANKELFASRQYGPSATDSVKQASVVEIRLQAKHYKPMLMRPDLFADVDAKNQQVCVPPADFTPNLPNADTFIAQTLAADAALVKAFTTQYALLDKKVQAAELNKTQLLAIYIHGVNKAGTSGYLAGRIRHIGLEYGNQDFFERALQDGKSGESPSRSNACDDFDVVIVDELKHAIARAIAIGDLDALEMNTVLDSAQQTVSMLG